MNDREEPIAPSPLHRRQPSNLNSARGLKQAGNRRDAPRFGDVHRRLVCI
jgi:hypothetical protein